MSYFLSPRAVRDIACILCYLERKSLLAAERFERQVQAACEFIASTPHAGHRKAEFATYPVLFWTISPYYLVYRINSLGTVEVVAVLHSSRDLRKALVNALD